MRSGRSPGAPLLGPLDEWGALPLLDALGLAADSSLTDEQRIIEAQNSMTTLRAVCSSPAVARLATSLLSANSD